ncbi:MAG: VOC family protein [Bradyrhizobiaceae bacterium]|nr:VOC family protein [Bradyrhizobiaceae bacterium]
MIRTFGLTHINLAVQDAERSFRFYADVFGLTAISRKPGIIQAQTPGCKDVIVFDQTLGQSGETAGISHFGFRLTSPDDIDEAVAAVERAGGAIRRRGEFRPGLPYAYVSDPDGYEIEIWFE